MGQSHTTLTSPLCFYINVYLKSTFYDALIANTQLSHECVITISPYLQFLTKASNTDDWSHCFQNRILWHSPSSAVHVFLAEQDDFHNTQQYHHLTLTLISANREMEHLHTPQSTILLFCCVMTNLELLHHDDHLLWTEKMMYIQLPWMWSSNRKRSHHIQWRTFGQWKRTQKMEYFPFHIIRKWTKDNSSHERHKEVQWKSEWLLTSKIWLWNCCEEENELMISLILHDAWWWNHSLSFHICCNERNKWMFFMLFQKRKDLWMMFHCWQHMKQ